MENCLSVESLTVMVVSKKVASVHDTSAVNLIVGCRLFACPMNVSTKYLLVYWREITSSI